MTKAEFESLAGKVSDMDFEVINTVYAFHPCISETDGKHQIADIYATFGMRVILDMHSTAHRAQQIEEAIRIKNIELNDLRASLNALRTP